MMDELTLPGGDYSGAFPLTRGAQLARVPKTVAQDSRERGGTVLPMAQAASAGYDPIADLSTRRQSLMGDLEKLRGEPDYSQQQQYARDRAASFLPNAMAATLFGMGPRAAKPLAQLAAQQAGESLQPLKVEGGFIDSGGNLVIDPGYKRQKQVADLRDDILNIDKLIQTTTDNQQRRALQAQQQQMMMALHQANLEMRQQGLNLQREMAAGRRADAEQRRLDRLADRGLGAKDRYAVEDRMGDDYRSLTKDDRAGLAATQQIATLPTDRAINSTEQMALVYLLNKFLDPGSVVREGEYDRAAKAQGMIERAAMLIPKLTTGAFLTPRMVGEIRDMAQLYERAAGSRIGAHAQDFHDRSIRRGLDPQGVIGADARFIAPPAAPGAPRSPVAQTPGGAATRVPRGGTGMQYMDAP